MLRAAAMASPTMRVNVWTPAGSRCEPRRRAHLVVLVCSELMSHISRIVASFTLFPIHFFFCLIFIFAFIFAYVRVFLRLRASAVQLCFGVKLRVDSARVPVRPPQLQAGVNGRFRYCCSGYAVWRATGGQPDAGGVVELPVCEGLEARYVPLPLLRAP